MNMTITIMTLVMILTFFTPFGVYYGVHLAKKKDYAAHRKIQNIIFLICVVGVLALEGLIQNEGGSGSLAKSSDYYETSFFKYTLFSHIIVAVLSYLLWAILIVISNLKYKKSLPGKFSKWHKTIGQIVLYGLVYTAISALAVYLMTLNLV